MVDGKRASHPPRRPRKVRDHRTEPEEESETQSVTDSEINEEVGAPAIETKPEPEAPSVRTDEKNADLIRSPVPQRPQHEKSFLDPYLVTVTFSRETNEYHACVLETSDVKGTGRNREEALLELEDKLITYVESRKRNGESLPEPLQNRSYPSKLEVPISQTLYRKLDQISRQDRVPVDQLVTELLSSAIERRTELRGSSRGNQGAGQQQQRHERHGGGGQQQHRRQGGGGGPQRRNIHDTLGNRENFMEYVRNLEKKGSGPTSWRKK